MRTSPYLTTTRGGRGRMRPLVIWTIVAFAFALTWHYDPQIYQAMAAPTDEIRERIESRAWYQCLRAIGYAPLWVAIGFAVLFQNWWTRYMWHGFLIGFVPALTGGVCEALQHAFRRVKPRLAGGVHHYHFVNDGTNPSFGFPSSHAGVAFGGAFIILMIWPRAGYIAVLLAVGCAWTRVLQGGHFVTDVFASALVGYALAWLLRPRRTARPTP